MEGKAGAVDDEANVDEVAGDDDAEAVNWKEGEDVRGGVGEEEGGVLIGVSVGWTVAAVGDAEGAGVDGVGVDGAGVDGARVDGVGTKVLEEENEIVVPLHTRAPAQI